MDFSLLILDIISKIDSYNKNCTDIAQSEKKAINYSKVVLDWFVKVERRVMICDYLNLYLI